MPKNREPLIMGIVNVTPDSFFAAQRTATVTEAVARGRGLFAAGADVVDVGGESTRPGATPVSTAEELARVLPVVEALAEHGAVSVDTTKAEVAIACARAGAVLLNDVGGTLAPVAAELGIGWVAMHAQGTPQTMQLAPTYDDVVAEVAAWLAAKTDEAHALGVTEVWMDPGVGFGKTAEHNWSLLRHLDELAVLASAHGARLLVGTSRKRFLGLLGGGDRPAEDRLDASLATAVVALATGADMVRVHDVAETRQAARIVAGELAA